MANVYIVSEKGVKAVIFSETELNKLKEINNINADKVFSDIDDAVTEITKMKIKKFYGFIFNIDAFHEFRMFINLCHNDVAWADRGCPLL